MAEPLPRVAVLMSTYNGERFLEEQLASLAAQHGVACELFVRDDGSTDATLAILRRWADRWPQLSAPLAGPNLGPGMSFLELLKSASADFDYYAFCDQDDVWLPGKLARAVKGLEPDGRPQLYCSQVTCVDERLTPAGEPFKNADGRFEHILFENIAYGITVVMNRAARDLIAHRAPQRGVIMHDWWCALVIAAFGAVSYDARSSVLYRQHGANAVGAQSNRFAEIWRLLRTLKRDRRRFYPIHDQAVELLRLYGEALSPARRKLVERLVASKPSLAKRTQFAFSRNVVRSRLSGDIAARALMLAGWY